MGGLGFELAKHLARNYRARLVLVSRKANETAGDAFARELSTEVLCCAADVADAESMQSVVDSAERRFGRINGVFHCAGELQDGLLLAKSRSEMERVLRPKVAGALVLDQLFARRSLDFMAFYSSVSAWLGLPGQIDYAAANAFLDSLAYHRRALGLPALTVNWGVLGGDGYVARNERVRCHPPRCPRIRRGDVWGKCATVAAARALPPVPRISIILV